MNKYTFVILFVLVLIFSFFLGKKLYKETHEGFCRDNVSAIIFNMKNELISIDGILGNSEEPTEDSLKQLKQKLLDRRAVLVNNLNMFYGQEIFS